jgi:hypothetical protein
MAAVAARESEIIEQPRNTLIESKIQQYFLNV